MRTYKCVDERKKKKPRNAQYHNIRAAFPWSQLGLEGPKVLCVIPVV
jgi:hypothetical protein